MLKSAQRPLLLFSDLDPVCTCLFCGNREERRYMCSQCRKKSLLVLFWL